MRVAIRARRYLPVPMSPLSLEDTFACTSPSWDTPALTVDLDVLENNINTLQAACDALEIGLRVHTKTHKTPEIAHMQIEAGASASARRSWVKPKRWRKAASEISSSRTTSSANRNWND